LKGKILKTKHIIFFIALFFFISNAGTNADEISNFIKKLEQKSNNIKTLYASIVTNGFDQDNNPVPLNISYWKSGDKIRKNLTDESETVTTLIRGDQFIVHYDKAGILLKNNVSKLTGEELKQFRFQNFLLDYYKLNDILEKYKIKELKKNKKEYVLTLTNERKENIDVVFEEKTLDLKKIDAELFTEGVDKLYRFKILFKEFMVNKPVDESVFDFDLSGIRQNVDDSDFE